MRKYPILFLSGFVQVFFVSVNTYFIAKDIVLGVLIAAFLISLVWSFNVRRVVFGKWPERIVYAGGAAIGAVSGLKSSAFLLQILNKFF